MGLKAAEDISRDSPVLSAEELKACLRKVGEERYHHRHPFHLLMHEGRLSQGQLQAWALNRYYYQSIIPIKDSIILSRSNDPGFRRVWRKRVVDHDGDSTHEGGIERWIKLAEATGLERDRVLRGDEVLHRAAVGQRLEALHVPLGAVLGEHQRTGRRAVPKIGFLHLAVGLCSARHRGNCSSSRWPRARRSACRARRPRDCRASAAPDRCAEGVAAPRAPIPPWRQERRRRRRDG